MAERIREVIPAVERARALQPIVGSGWKHVADVNLEFVSRLCRRKRVLDIHSRGHLGVCLTCGRIGRLEQIGIVGIEAELEVLEQGGTNQYTCSPNEQVVGYPSECWTFGIACGTRLRDSMNPIELNLNTTCRCAAGYLLVVHFAKADTYTTPMFSPNIDGYREVSYRLTRIPLV